MEFVITGVRRELTPDLKQFINDKIREKIVRHTDKVTLLEVWVDKESAHHEQGLERVRVTAWVPGNAKTRDGKKRLTVQAVANNLHDAVNMASKTIMRRIHDWADETKPTRKARS